jgi:hypothetical protein
MFKIVTRIDGKLQNQTKAISWMVLLHLVEVDSSVLEGKGIIVVL